MNPHPTPPSGEPTQPAVTQRLDEVVAVVVTHRRERLAGDVVRGLVDREGFPPERVIVVVNGEGGLDDPALERSVSLLRLEKNIGPAGGFRRGLEAAATKACWAYLCEDDVGLFDLPSPRVADVLTRVETDPDKGSIGGVVAYGRQLDHRTGRTTPIVPCEADAGKDFLPVDVAAWGSSLVRCATVHRGILPDDSLFFGFEDFDYWLAMQEHGFRVVLDVPTGLALGGRVFYGNRDRLLRGQRAVDEEEPWRKYYEARNFFQLWRRHGRWSWIASHSLMTVRRIQQGPTMAHRTASLHGFLDGLRGRRGAHRRYGRGA